MNSADRMCRFTSGGALFTQPATTLARLACTDFNGRTNARFPTVFYCIPRLCPVFGEILALNQTRNEAFIEARALQPGLARSFLGKNRVHPSTSFRFEENNSPSSSSSLPSVFLFLAALCIHSHTHAHAHFRVRHFRCSGGVIRFPDALGTGVPSVAVRALCPHCRLSWSSSSSSWLSSALTWRQKDARTVVARRNGQTSRSSAFFFGGNARFK